jgi:post-segregation antitoxin (ccd killing protein)
MDDKNETVVTSLKVDKELWKQAKKQAIDDGTTLQDVLNAALKDWLAKDDVLRREGEKLAKKTK